MTTPAPTPAPVVPGKTLGIVALVLAFLAPLIGAILGFVARNQSKAAGVENTPAKIAIILGIIFTVVYIVIVIASVALSAAVVNQYS